MKKFLKQYAPHIGASAIAITAVATAAVTPLPGSLPASVATGGTILAADINAMIDSLNILDARTDGDAPVDDVDIVNKGYLDGEIAILNTAISNAGDDLGNHTATQNIDGGGHLITNIGTPIAGTDAVNKDYVDDNLPDTTGVIATYKNLGCAISGGPYPYGDTYRQNCYFCLGGSKFRATSTTTAEPESDPAGDCS